MKQFLEKEIGNYEYKFDKRIKETLVTIHKANYHRNIASKVMQMSNIYNDPKLADAQKAAEQSKLQARIAEINEMYKKSSEGNKR